jgi:cytochrome c oxidase subunit II
MATAETGPAAPAAREPRHGLRIFLIWAPLAIAADLLIYLVLGPHLPPGTMSTTAGSQQFDIKVMSVLAAPVLLFVLTYFGYALIVWRQRPDDEEDGPPLHGHTGVQATWITVTAAIVLGLFGFGTVELINPHGAGAGEGPSPIWKPAGHTLVVQVIGQQWKFTYRYPQYGGFETTALMLPRGQWVQFDVTSLDVIHSFWPYQLGVKADANPGVNNVAYTQPQHAGRFVVRCAELCGLWHGTMDNYGYVVSPAKFQAWASATETQLASVTKMLPPFATTYDPTVVPQMSAAMVKAGLLGGAGLYYPSQDPVQP